MKKTILFFLLLATGCATTNHSQTANADAPPVYYTGNNEPVMAGVFIYTAHTNNLNQQSL